MSDKTIETSPVPTCRNCDQLLPNNAFFCPYCGQRNTDGRITFGEIFSQFMDNLFNLYFFSDSLLQHLLYCTKYTLSSGIYLLQKKACWFW